MKYSEFLEKSGQSSNSLGMVLREESESISKSLLSKVKGPSFMEEIADLESIVLMQSTGGIHSPPKYDHFEQILCSVDGLVQTKLVPHVYR
jgi:hypothetical protein